MQISSYKIISDLFNVYRSLTGKGNRKTLLYLKKIIPSLKIKYFKTGDKFNDWTVPKEWNVKKAFIKDLNGNKLVDFEKNNLHLVGYSAPIKKKIKFTELKKHLHYIPHKKNSIPYVTSYFKKYWGFCLTYNNFIKMNSKNYYVEIDSKFSKGRMDYGELFYPGKSPKEIIFTTYICHPAMANNELSGVAVTTKIAEWLGRKKRKYSYRFLFLPETLGSIAYISKNFKKLKKNVLAGYVVTCVGDPGPFSLMASRKGNQISDRVARIILKKKQKKFKEYSFNQRGSQERQFCSPLVDLPFSSVMRSKYGEFKEYHTSDDNLSFVKTKSLNQSIGVYQDIINFFEKEKIFKSTKLCEPMYSKYNLYPTISYGKASLGIKNLRNITAYADGNTFDFEIAEKAKISLKLLKKLSKILLKNRIIKILNK